MVNAEILVFDLVSSFLEEGCNRVVNSILNLNECIQADLHCQCRQARADQLLSDFGQENIVLHAALGFLPAAACPKLGLNVLVNRSFASSEVKHANALEQAFIPRAR